VFPVKYELGFYIPEDGILHSYRRENLKSYRKVTGCSSSTCSPVLNWNAIMNTRQKYDGLSSSRVHLMQETNTSKTVIERGGGEGHSTNNTAIANTYMAAGYT
jgi:hypothetical protein